MYPDLIVQGKKRDRGKNTCTTWDDCIKWPTVENILCNGYLKGFVNAMYDPPCMDHL